MSKLIIVCGLGGSGKTTTAKALSKKLNISCIHKDSIKAALFDELNFKTNDTYKLFFKLAEEQVSNKVDIIIESPFTYNNDIKLVKNWIKKYDDIDLHCVICAIDNKTRRRRVESRLRHECHEDADNILKKNLDEEIFDFSLLPGKLINITTDQSTNKIVNQIINDIK